MLSQMYHSELELKKAYTPDTEGSIFSYPFLMIIILYRIYDKRDDFDCEIVKFPFLDGDVPRSISYGYLFLNSSDLLVHQAML